MANPNLKKKPPVLLEQAPSILQPAGDDEAVPDVASSAASISAASSTSNKAMLFDLFLNNENISKQKLDASKMPKPRKRTKAITDSKRPARLLRSNQAKVG